MNRLLACSLLLLWLSTNGIADAFAGGGTDSNGRPGRPLGDGSAAARLLRVHAGLSNPAGRFDDLVNRGWELGAEVALRIGSGLYLSPGIAYYSFDGRLMAGDVAMVPITLSVSFLPTSGTSWGAWLGGGVGLYVADIDYAPVTDLIGVRLRDSDTSPGINVTAGVTAPPGDRGVWSLGVGYHHVMDSEVLDESDFVSLQAGYAFFL